MTDTQRLDYLSKLELISIAAQRKMEIDALGAPVPDVKPTLDDYLVLAIDGTTCWGKTYRDAIDNAMRHDGLI